MPALKTKVPLLKTTAKELPSDCAVLKTGDEQTAYILSQAFYTPEGDIFEVRQIFEGDVDEQGNIAQMTTVKKRFIQTYRKGHFSEEVESNEQVPTGSRLVEEWVVQMRPWRVLRSTNIR